MILPLLLAAPWLGLLLFVLLRVRLPREVPRRAPRSTPRVTVVVPARDEAVNIETCLRSLTGLAYPDFEVIVVDDRSRDDTADRARSCPPGTARALTVLDGAELPDGWLGKPWACRQGADAASGELLLFTDADTVHGPDLLERAVAAMEEDHAELLTVTGRQLMVTFWERLVQPQVFFVMLLRYFDVERMIARGRWRSAIANGQFMLFRRDAYDAVGGHAAVKGDVVEDLALAQLVVRRGRRMSMRMAESCFATRMYRSLGGIVAGWSKNIVVGGLRTMPPSLRPFVAPASALSGTLLWLVPPSVLLASSIGLLDAPAALAWSVAAVALSVVLWTMVGARMGAPPWYGFLYPLGASIGMYIFLRAWRRGRNVEWKGRRYVVEDPGEPA